MIGTYQTTAPQQHVGKTEITPILLNHHVGGYFQRLRRWSAKYRTMIAVDPGNVESWRANACVTSEAVRQQELITRSVRFSIRIHPPDGFANPLFVGRLTLHRGRAFHLVQERPVEPADRSHTVSLPHRVPR